MRRLIFSFGFVSILFQPFNLIQADSNQHSYREEYSEATQSLKKNVFFTFTGKIRGNHVRMRVQPTLDGMIFKEMTPDEYVLVLGETEEFYAISPPDEVKGYVYRTFVLDGVVEGNNVNVRLEPDLSAPIIAKLHEGDIVQGTVSSLDKKWMEIVPPASTRMYIAKEYIEKIGDGTLYSKLKRRHLEVLALLKDAETNSYAELQKSVDQIRVEKLVSGLNKIINEYRDFPQEMNKAKEMLLSVQAAYTEKQFAAEKNRASQKEDLIKAEAIASSIGVLKANLAMHTQAWIPVEKRLFDQWSIRNNSSSMDSFYAQEKENALLLTGRIEPYQHMVKNKPGDFLLLDENHIPVAFIYSTQVDLREKVGQQVTVQASPRDNNHFAYPAYFVLGIE